MLPDETRKYMLEEVSPSVIEAAKAINFAQRYYDLLKRFPKLAGDFNPKVPIERQQALVAEFPYPMRFYKGEGGYYKLNNKKFSNPNMNLMIEMRQWVCFDFNYWVDDARIGGGNYKDIAVVERLVRGETVVWEDYSKPNPPWCYNETQLKAILTESFALFDDLCQQLAQISENEQQQLATQARKRHEERERKALQEISEQARQKALANH